MIKSPGYGRKGDKGDVGATGATGPIGLASTVPGPAGSNASATPLGTATPLAAGTATAGSSTNAAREDHRHPAQTVPAAATATPLVSQGTGAVGTSAAYAREDHRHPVMSGVLQLVGNVTITETLLVSLALGIQRKTATLSGIATTDKLMFAPNGVPTAGCEAVNVYASATNQVTVACYLPALGIGATYSIPISVYRVV